jgi:surface polysaccharide O-acyltransferase-like enzyme
MEFLLFAVVAVALFFLSDWLLRRIEATVGRELEQRTLVFFAIFLGSLLVSFALIRQLFGS